jgi:hypothetical protein
VRHIGLWLLKDNRYAIIAVLLCSLLLLIPLPGDFLVGLIIGFVTLKRGPLYGLYLLLFVALLAIGVTFQVHEVNVFVFLFLRAALVWIGAIVLRRFYSWTITIEVVTGIGLITVLFAHLFIPELQTIWKHTLASYFELIQTIKIGSLQVTSQQLVKMLTPVMTGLMVLFGSIGIVLQLMLARFWFSSLFNPSGFAQEFAMIRVSRIASVIFLVMIILTGFYHQILIDYLPVLFLPFIIAGLSLLYFFAMMKRKWWPFFLLIAIVLFVFFGVSAMLLALLSFIDSWFNLRLRFNLTSKRK